MISEKKLYETQAEWALNHTRYPDVIWAEDLFDITIVPYQGSIRKLPHYADMKDRLEIYGLIVVMHTIQEVRILDFARKRCGEYGREYIEQILDSFVYEQQAYRRCMTIIGIGDTSPEGMVDEICRKLLETGEKASIGAFIRACKKSK